MKKYVFLFMLPLLFSACGGSRNAANFPYAQIEYRYQSMSKVEVAGVNFKDLKSSSNPLTASKIAAAILTNTLPVVCTINLDVRNPNMQSALLDGFQYILYIDNIEMTRGQANQALQVPANNISTLPLTIAFDMKQALNGQSSDVLKNMAFNFAGIGAQPANITLKIKSRMLIDGLVAPKAGYIPIMFSYGIGSN